jgi:UDP-glucose 4-epimerase
MTPHMRIVVTGGAGFIGSHLVDRLVGDGHAVTVVDDLSSGKRSNVNRRAALRVIDVVSPRLGKIFTAFRPNAVFHLAAQKNIRTSFDSPLFDARVNILGSLRVAECARASGTKILIFPSTAGVYPAEGNMPIPETARVDPASPYAIAKLATEQYLDFFHRIFGIRTVTLRYANVYGPRQDPGGEAGVVAIFIEKLMRHKPMVVNGRGTQTRDYVYVDDVVSANIAALTHAVHGQFNIGTGRETSVNQLVRTLAAVSGRRGAVRHGPAIRGEVPRNALDARRARRYLGWTPSMRLDEGLRRTLEWFMSTSGTAR